MRFGLALVAFHCLLSRADASLDVVFVIDTSASFTTDLPLFQSSILAIMNDIVATVDNDTRFGVCQFEDYAIEPFGTNIDEPYRRVVPLTSSVTGVKNYVDTMQLGAGNEMKESQLAAVYQLLTGEGQMYGQSQVIPANEGMDFRSDAQKIILLWTDAGFNVPTTAGYPGPSFSEVISELTDSSVDPPYRFVGLSLGSSAVTDLKTLATATSASAVEQFDCISGQTIAQGASLVCKDVGGSTAIITAAFVNMVAAAYEIDKPYVAPPLTCGGIAALFCSFLAAFACLT